MFRQPKPIVLPGKRVAVLLLHAYTGSPNDMNMMAKSLNAAGYGVYAPLFAGHGTVDPHDLLAVDPEVWWAQTKQWVQEAQAYYPRVYVFGLSMGGLFAMRALEELPELVGGGVFASPIVAGKDNLPVNFWRYYRYMRRLAELPDDSEAMQPALDRHLAGIAAIGQTVTAHLPKLHTPVFIAQGGEDEIIDATRAYRLKAAITQVPVSFHWYESASHVLTVNNAHHQLEADVHQFIQRNEE